MDERIDAAERARRRASWPVHIARLGDPEPSLADSTTVEERIGMMWSLAVDAWTFAGREIPRNAREDTPVSIVPAVRG